MSILDRDNPLNYITPARMAANTLIDQTKITYQQVVKAFNQGAKIFWGNGMGASPQEIATELGTDAKEIFELHYKLGQFIASIKPETIEEGLSLVGNFTINEDGTVTIIVPETEPTPSPE